MKDTKYHYRLNGDFIECWNGHDGWTKIASVIEVRPVMHFMRRCQLAEDIEELMDSFLADTSGIAPARSKIGISASSAGHKLQPDRKAKRRRAG